MAAENGSNGFHPVPKAEPQEASLTEAKGASQPLNPSAPQPLSLSEEDSNGPMGEEEKDNFTPWKGSESKRILVPGVGGSAELTADLGYDKSSRTSSLESTERVFKISRIPSTRSDESAVSNGNGHHRHSGSEESSSERDLSLHRRSTRKSSSKAGSSRNVAGSWRKPRRGSVSRGFATLSDDEEGSVESVFEADNQMKILTKQYLRASARPGYFLDQKVEQTSHQMATGLSVFESSKPFETALCRRWFQSFFLILAVYFVYSISVSIAAHQNLQPEEGSVFRFTASQMRAGSAQFLTEGENSMHNIKDIGLLHDGCDISLPTPTTVMNATGFYLTLAETVKFNGWHLTTAISSANLDPIRFHLEMQDLAGGDWKVVGSSTWRFGDAAQFVPLDQSRELPLGRGELVEFDLRVPWSWVVGVEMHKAIHMIGFFCIFFCGVLQKGRWGKFVLCAQFGVDSVISMVAAIGIHAADGSENLSIWWFSSLASLFIPIFLILGERQLLTGLLLYGILSMCLGFVDLLVLYRHSPARGDAVGSFIGWLINAFFAIVLGAGYVVLRRRKILQSRTAILLDAEMYNAIWDQITATEYQNLEDLSEQVKKIPASHYGTAPQQLNRKAASATPAKEKAGSASQSQASKILGLGNSGIFKLAEDTEPGTVNPKNPIKSLDQIYQQAAVADIFLLEKIKYLATHSRGLFELKPQKSKEQKQRKFELWNDIKKDPEKTAAVKFAGLKSESRAIEKSIRVYDHDSSRLVDVARHHIVFVDVADMSRCLGLLEEDKEIKLVRIKNRMDPAHSAEISGGFRDLLINLRIVTPKTCELHVDTHVCELQLVLLSFIVHNDDESNKRYREYRNLRGRLY